MNDAHLAPSTRHLYEYLRVRKPSPRVQQAIRLYATGAVPTKKAAAEAMALSPSAIYTTTMPSIGNAYVRELTEDINSALTSRSVDRSRVLALMSRSAVGKIHELMTFSENEHVQLNAAVDIADRAPDTAKTHKVQVASVQLTSQDAKEISDLLEGK